MKAFLAGLFCLILAVVVLSIGTLMVKQKTDVIDHAKVIYKLENDRYTQITSLDQIKNGVYIIIK